LNNQVFKPEKICKLNSNERSNTLSQKHPEIKLSDGEVILIPNDDNILRAVLD